MKFVSIMVQNQLLVGNIMIVRIKVLTNAHVVGQNCLVQKPNLIRVLVGQVSGSHLMMKTLDVKMILVMG